MARKSDIINLLVTELKKINKSVDTRTVVPRTPYTYKTNIYKNVFSNLKYLDTINDFPTICFYILNEDYRHIGGGIKYNTLLLNVRGYVRDTTNVLNVADDLLDDIDYVINSIRYLHSSNPICVEESKVLSVVTDEGLFDPFGVVDVVAEITYEVNEQPTIPFSVFSDEFSEEYS